MPKNITIIKKLNSIKKGVFNKSNKKKTFILILLSVVVFLLYFFRSAYLVAVVNGFPITRFTVIRELEKQGGSQVLETVITKELIKQEAKRKGVEISEDKINEEIEKTKVSIEAQGLTLEDALSMQGQDINTLKESIRVNLIIEEMLSDNIEVTEDEIEAYFEENKAIYGEDAVLISVKEDIKDRLTQEKLYNAYQDWMKSIQEQSDIKYLISY